MEQMDLESLGERIVKAARLAVAMHLYQAVAPDEQQDRGTDGRESDGRSIRQRVVIGGTGPRVVDEFTLVNDADLRHG